MGKKLIIPGADFSQNAIEIATIETVYPNTSFQIVNNGTAVNVQSDANGIYEHEGYIKFAGGQQTNMFNGAIATSGSSPEIKKVRSLRLELSSLASCFRNCPNLEEVSISDIIVDSESVTVSYAFGFCENLTNVIFPTNRRIVLGSNLNYMFQSCSKIKKIDLSMFDTSGVTKIANFWIGEGGAVLELEELNLSGWDLSSLDTSSISNYQYAFFNCNNLTKVIVNNCDSSTITKLITILGAYSTKTYTQGTDAQGNTVLIGA